MKTQYRIINIGKGTLRLSPANLHKVGVGGYSDETIDNLLNSKADRILELKYITGTSYNVIAEDSLVQLIYDGIVPMNIIIPNNVTVPLPIGTIFYTVATDTGVLSVSGENGVTFQTAVGLTAGQNEVRKYTKRAANVWGIEGSVVSSADMILSSPQTVSGLKTFLNNMFGLRNSANTFTSFFHNYNTTQRYYTLQDKSGTLADLADVGAKMNTPTGGQTDYLPKFLTAVTQGKSVLREVLGKLGIDTVNKPTADISLGRQLNRSIEVEQSPNTVSGRDLIVSAGRTINYIEDAGFNRLFTGLNMEFRGIIIEPISQDLYVSGPSGTFKRAADGSFQNEYAGGIFNRGIGYDNIGNIYVAIATGGFIKKTISSGTWGFQDAIGSTGTPISIGGNSIGDLYLGTTDGVFKQTGGSGNFVKLFTGDVRCLSISPIDDSVYISTTSNGGSIFKQTAGIGAFNFIQVIPSYGYNVCCLNSGDVLVVFGQNIYKQTAQQGLFEITTIVAINDMKFLAGDVNSSLYSVMDFVDIFFLDNNAAGTPNLDGGTKSERAGTGKGSGKSRWDVWTGQKTASGTNMQALTKRIEVDELGALKLLTTHQYADNAAALAAGLEVGSMYWTATGELRIII